MTAGTMNGYTLKGGHYRGDNVIAIEIMADLTVDGVLANVAKGTFVPRSCGKQPKGRDQVGAIRVGLIRGELFLDETGPRPIVVESLHQIVTIGPCVWPNPILIVPVGFPKVDNVHPKPSHLLAMVGGSQQAIDRPFPRQGFGVCQKGVHLGGGRRQTKEVKIGPAKQGPAVRRGRWF